MQEQSHLPPSQGAGSPPVPSPAQVAHPAFPGSAQRHRPSKHSRKHIKRRTSFPAEPGEQLYFICCLHLIPVLNNPFLSWHHPCSCALNQTGEQNNVKKSYQKYNRLILDWFPNPVYLAATKNNCAGTIQRIVHGWEQPAGKGVRLNSSSTTIFKLQSEKLWIQNPTSSTTRNHPAAMYSIVLFVKAINK